MQILLTPVPGSAVVRLRIEDETLTIDDVRFDLEALAAAGLVHKDGDRQVVIIPYGEHGGVSTCNLTDRHSVEVIPTDLPPQPPPPPPKADVEAEARAALEVQRLGWTVDRWQIKTVLGRDRWEVIEAFGTGEDAPWGLKTVIEDAMTIPRVSQTVELLAHILGLSEDEVDELFQVAMALAA